MRTNIISTIVAVLLLTGAVAGAQGADVVYVANPGEGTIYAIDPSAGLTQTPVMLFEERKFDVGDMVVGPDDLLYVCAPDEGIVFRFDPNDAPPYSLGTVDMLDTAGVNEPQCGWFSDKGDLFLSDRNSSTAVWIYQDLVALTSDAPEPALIELVPASGDFYGFEGQGITQAAPGDLYFVDQANGTVGGLAFDPIFRFHAPTSAGPTVMTSGLTNPVGIARTAEGTYFIASGDEVTTHGTTPCAVPYTFDGQTPQFLQITADDVLFVTSTAKKAATLWQIDAKGCGPAEPIFTFDKPDYTPSLSGIALPRTDREKPAFVASTDPSLELVFSFWDHAYELGISPADACGANGIEVAPIIATEMPPHCLANLITDEYIYKDENDLGDGVSGVPVPYAGDGGVAQLYTLTGSCAEVDKQITHAISAYSVLVSNPRIVRCEFDFPPGYDYCDLPPGCKPGATGCSLAYCELIELESFFPFNGVFPDDARISGAKSSAASDFSEYFVADIDLADGSGDDTPGCFCGWEDPLPDVDFVDPDDPFLGLPSYNSGSAVPVKFRVAVLPDGASCVIDDPCSGAPEGYVTGGQILLSVAKIYDGAGESDFVPISPTATSANTPGNIFGNPNSPSTPFHYNLDTSGFEPGVYQAVAVALTDNFSVEWTYFAIH